MNRRTVLNQLIFPSGLDILQHNERAYPEEMIDDEGQSVEGDEKAIIREENGHANELGKYV
jgi:hypothetical protein